MKVMVVALTALVVFALAGCGSTKGIRVTAEQDGRTINLKTGQIVSVELDANHTTGYSWSLSDSAASVLEAVGSPVYTSEPQPDGRVGYGGIEVWKFRATRSGQGKLEFNYRRPFESAASSAQTVRFTISVSEP